MRQLFFIGLVAVIIAAYGPVQSNAFDSPISPPVETPTPAPNPTGPVPIIVPTATATPVLRRLPVRRPVPPCELDERC